MKKGYRNVIVILWLIGLLPVHYVAVRFIGRQMFYNMYRQREKSHVKVSVLCPGPVNTGFNDRANVKFSLKSLTPEYVVDYCISQMMKNKLVIIPSFRMKFGIFANRLFSKKFILKIIYNIQKKKDN